MCPRTDAHFNSHFKIGCENRKNGCIAHQKSTSRKNRFPLRSYLNASMHFSCWWFCIFFSRLSTHWLNAMINDDAEQLSKMSLSVNVNRWLVNSNQLESFKHCDALLMSSHSSSISWMPLESRDSCNEFSWESQGHVWMRFENSRETQVSMEADSVLQLDKGLARISFECKRGLILESIISERGKNRIWINWPMTRDARQIVMTRVT